MKIGRFDSSLQVQGLDSDDATCRNVTDRSNFDEKPPSTSNNERFAMRKQETESEASTTGPRVRSSYPNSRNAGDMLDKRSSLDKDRFYRDPSECGSSAGPLEQNDPLRKWKAMKENGFLSSSYGGIPLPKPRGRQSKDSMMKMRMEIARREQIDRFAKIAAPSGLLNELNPGIINHVRNSKQVHSIIEALVKDGTRGVKQARHVKDREKPAVIHRSENFKEACDVNLAETFEPENEDRLVLMLGKNGGSKRTGFGDFLSGFQSLPSLSFKAAMVASQWLDLLHEDIKGRLGALRRSKKRVRAVIHTELPFLLSDEFNSNQENEPYTIPKKGFSSEFRSRTNSLCHRAKWTELFNQMDRALAEEEEQLEVLLNQVKMMQLRCEWGLRRHHPSEEDVDEAQQMIISRRIFRSEDGEDRERDLAVTAAAASLYSTCNFIPSTE